MISVMKSRKIRWAGMQHEWKRRKFDIKHWAQMGRAQTEHLAVRRVEERRAL
jgi:hypothetical protein